MQTDVLCSCIVILQNAVNIVQAAFCVFLKSFPDRNLYLSSSLSVTVLWAIFSSFALILDVSILNVGLLGVSLVSLLDYLYLWTLQYPELPKLGLPCCGAFMCLLLQMTLSGRLRLTLKGLNVKNVNFFLCNKLNKASLEGSRRLSKEGKKHPSELSFFPLYRLGSDEANLRRSAVERSAVSRPSGPQRSVSVSSGNRKITWLKP